MNMDIKRELELIESKIFQIPTARDYWMIRTNAGLNYNAFVERGFVAIQHNDFPLSLINELSTVAGSNSDSIIRGLKSFLTDKVISEGEIISQSFKREIGLKASQVYKFVYEVKKGDFIVIPSENSTHINFGIVSESHISDSIQGADDLILKKRVDWKKEIRRFKLDPFLYRMFTAHQAINNVKREYAEIIERSVNDYFILDDSAHLILNVRREQQISAKDLFGLGYEILQLIDEIAEHFDLNISSDDLEVKINLNSQGKIDLKSRVKKTTIVAAILLSIFGGGYESGSGVTIRTDGVPGLIRAIDDFLTSSDERKMRMELFETYKDSLNVSTSNDFIFLLNQISEDEESSE